MERIDTKKLPPIFKMSVLWNILPYYGHLHRWRRLLEKINKKTKDIWDQNREQLMYIGRDFKRDIELDNLKEDARHLRPTRSWLDLFSLSLSNCFYYYKFDFTTLVDNLSEDEVIVIDSHDDIFKGYQIYFWRKECISDILPAIKCPSFKSEIKIFKTSEMNNIRVFISAQNHKESIVIVSTNEKLSINLVYGDTVKITPWTFRSFQKIKFLDKLQERCELWEIDDCTCKPKKIRVLADGLKNFKYAIEELESISNINNVKLGMYILSANYGRSFSKYNTIFFNHSARRMSDKEANLIFTGDTLAVVYKGNYYNFRLDQRTKESEYGCIKGKI